ncbi:MAG: beta-N-acetylhexosaminidase [Alphaproteobacteria bacterium]
MRSAPAAVIFGCAGTRLDAEEHALFRDVDPLGFILFARNCDTPEQIRDLVAALRDSVGRADAPVLIDQEGGRVARLKPPLGHVVPPARRFGELFVRDSEAGMAAAHTAGRLLASDLAMLGIDVDCAPVLDLARPETTVAIGDRAFSGEVDAVVALGKALAEGLLAGGVLPVVKHMPGHGRARVDSHAEMPSVDADAETLTVEDFAPFKALSDMPMGMTAHVRYTALDADAPATHSPSVIAEAIRGVIGFDGLLLSDDLAMEALDGSHGERAARALAAGCDVALHCTGALADMRDVANYIHAMTGEACRRWRRAVRRRSTAATSARAETPEALAAAFDVFMAG